MIDLATVRGWLWFHPVDSRKNIRGYPDLTLVRKGRLIHAELKSAKGRIRPEQEVWLSELERGPGEVYVWRPDDIREIEQILL